MESTIHTEKPFTTYLNELLIEARKSFFKGNVSTFLKKNSSFNFDRNSFFSLNSCFHFVALVICAKTAAESTQGAGAQRYSQP